MVLQNYSVVLLEQSVLFSGKGNQDLITELMYFYCCQHQTSELIDHMLCLRLEPEK
jgi:hypothetical protein